MINIAFIDLGTNLVSFFSEVAKALEPEISAYFYCTKPKPWSLADRLGLAVYPQPQTLQNPTDIPDEIKNTIFNKKILAENSDYKKLTTKLSRIYPSLKTFLEQQQIDAIFLWNGSGLVSSTAIFLAQDKGLKTVFGENGYFYNTIQLDTEGVNQASSITAKIAKAYRSVVLEAAKLQQLRELIDAYRNNTPVEYAKNPSKVKPAWSARISGELNNLLETDFKTPKSLNRNIPSDPGILPDKTIFIPFQVVKDSQLLLYSPLVGNDMELFLSNCHAAVKAVAGDYKIVVKLHPADVNNVDYTNLVERYPDVIFLKDYPSNQLIQSASLIITINSTVGVEALIHEKPVITLGDNFYNVPEVVHHVDDLSHLPQAIKTALSSPVDKEKTQRLLYYLLHCYFTHGSWKNFSQQSIQAVAVKISQLLKHPRTSA